MQFYQKQVFTKVKKVQEGFAIDHRKLQVIASFMHPGPGLMVTLPSMVTNYHGNLDFDWLLSPVTMVVAIDGKVTINGKFYAPMSWFEFKVCLLHAITSSKQRSQPDFFTTLLTKSEVDEI